MEYLKRAMEIQAEVVANRRYLHQHPELGHNLDNTVRFVKEKLTEMGYAPADCGDHGIVALAGGKKPGKCILIRADMDALPMKEESGLEFSSLTDSAAHTCGHDTHTAMLLGAAKLMFIVIFVVIAANTVECVPKAVDNPDALAVEFP